MTAAQPPADNELAEELQILHDEARDRHARWLLHPEFEKDDLRADWQSIERSFATSLSAQAARLAAAEAAERERCARIADGHAAFWEREASKFEPHTDTWAMCRARMMVATDIAAAIRTTEAARVGESLLRRANDPLPPGCFCKPGECMAPKIMGHQTQCRDPQKAAARVGETPEGGG